MKSMLFSGIFSLLFGVAMAADKIEFIKYEEVLGECSVIALKYSSDRSSMEAHELNILLNCVSADLQSRMGSYEYGELAYSGTSTVIEYTSTDSCGGDPQAICIGPGPGGTTPINPKGPGPRSTEFEFIANVPNLPKVIAGESAVLWNADTGTSVQLEKPVGMAVMRENVQVESMIFMAPFDENTKILAPAEWK